MTAFADRFDEALLNKNGPIPEKHPDLGPCWLYPLSARSRSGYRAARDIKGSIFIHRFTYGYYREPIPHGLIIHHLCENPACCNPWHLQALTQKEHVRLHPVGVKTGVRNRAKTYCPKGHEYNEENTGRDKRGGRECRTCRRLQAEARRRRNGVLACGKGGIQKARTHCPAGHEYNEENTLRTKNGGRNCRACHRLREYARKARMRVS